MKKFLVIPSLTIFWLFIALFYRIIGYNVYYCVLNGYFRKLYWIKFFKRINIVLIKEEYKYFSEYIDGYLHGPEFIDRILVKISNSYLFKHINNLLSAIRPLNEKNTIVWRGNIHSYITIFLEQFGASEYLVSKCGFRRGVVITSNSLAALLGHDLSKDVKFYFLPDLSYISKILSSNLWIILRRIISLLQSQCIQRDTNEHEYANPIVGLEDFEVAYFPHCGIYYGDLYIKDFYYSEDEGSPFHRSKILHVSINNTDLNRTDSFFDKTYKYYEENKISFISLTDIAIDRGILLKNYLDFIRPWMISDLLVYGLNNLMILLKVFNTILIFYYKCMAFKRLRFAFFGYDINSPTELSYSLSLLNINTCAIVERPLTIFAFRQFLILDYYFVNGPIVNKGRMATNFNINTLFYVGLIRVDKIINYERDNIYDEKYDTIKKSKKLILALDSLLPRDKIVDLESMPDMRSESQKKFYYNLIRLAKELQDVHITIKGKSTKQYQYEELRDIVEEVARIDNIEIEMDLTRYNPYFISEKADLTIAIYTSLADELLAAGRQVIIYETNDYCKVFTELHRIHTIVDNYDDLKRLVEYSLNGGNLHEKITPELYGEFFSESYKGDVKKRISERLREIYDLYR